MDKSERRAGPRTPSEEIRIAGIVLSNTCIDRQLQGQWPIETCENSCLKYHKGEWKIYDCIGCI